MSFFVGRWVLGSSRLGYKNLANSCLLYILSTCPISNRLYSNLSHAELKAYDLGFWVHPLVLGLRVGGVRVW